MEKKLVSVIIPTYNRASLVGKAIKSVLQQTYSNIEVIVVDDGSEDNTESVVKQIDDRRIYYIRLEENGGVSRARNVGINVARGDYIAFQDSDDIWYTDKLYEEMQEMQSSESCQMVFCKYECTGNTHRIVPAEDDFNIDTGKDGFLKTLLEGNRIGMPTVLLKKKILQETGMFNEELSTLEDWELFLRIAEVGEIRFVKKVLVKVNDSTNGVNSLVGYQRVKTELLILEAYWKRYENKRIFEYLISSILSDLEHMSEDEVGLCVKSLEKYRLDEVYIGLIEKYGKTLKEYKRSVAYLDTKLSQQNDYNKYLLGKVDKQEAYNDYLQNELNEQKRYNEYLKKKRDEQKIYNDYLQNELNEQKRYNEYLKEKHDKQKIYNDYLQNKVSEQKKYNNYLQIKLEGQEV